MSIIKRLREKSGNTQMSLAEKTGLSLRTIQRLESSTKAPKGHTLKVLADAFKVETSALQNNFLEVDQEKESEKLSVKLINLSALAFFLFPFGNVILPIILWRKKSKSAWVKEAGRKIVNFQILWTLTLCFLLCISSFLDNSPHTSFPLILIVLFLLLAVNLLVVILTAHAIQQDKIDFLKLPIRFL